MMIKVRYISDHETIALEKGKVYEVISIEKGWYRIMTELDEDYLFPPEAFEVAERDNMKNDYTTIEKHNERISILKNGGKIPCPFCKNGNIVMKNEGAYLCTNCGKGFVYREPIELP